MFGGVSIGHLRAPLIWVFFVLVVSVIVSLASMANIAHGVQDEYNWLTDKITVEIDPDLSDNPNDYGTYGQCTDQEVSLPNMWGYYQPATACIFYAKSYIYTVHDGRLFVNLAGGTTMFPVRDWGFGSISHIVPSPQNDNFMYGSLLVEDLPTKIVPNQDAARPAYNFVDNPIYYLSQDETGFAEQTELPSLSKNGQWAVLKISNLGYVRVNTTDKKVKWVAPPRYGNEFLAISNDGRHILTATFGYDPIRIYSLDGCGVEDEVIKTGWKDSESIADSQCPYLDLSNDINVALGSVNYTSPVRPEFSNDGKLITTLARPNNAGGLGINLFIGGGSDDSINELSYLALGDSYSSGEGDIAKREDGSGYYTSSSQGLGGCHVSTRSYPFLLKVLNGIDDDMMQSVACSGARITPDYHGGDHNYRGQGNRTSGMSEEHIRNAQSSALQDFTPGMVQQLAFVREYQPKVITVTGGGNDVKFSEILKSCIFNTWANSKHDSCNLAVAKSEERILLGDAIRTQFDQTAQFIRAVKEVSPSTTIYVVGYPTFLSDGRQSCVNGGSLDHQERTAINEGVEYLNDLIRAAAEQEGAYFRDVEDALRGGRMCEGSKYMTGLLNHFDGSEAAQMFHPNSIGHEKMAAAIAARGFTTVASDNPLPVEMVVPKKPESFGTSDHVPTEYEQLIENTLITAGRAYKITSPAGWGMMLGDTATLKIYSKPVELAKFEADGNDGVIEFTVPQHVRPGIHMLVLDITSLDGSKRRQYQFIELRSDKKEDRDGDGIIDSKDSCLYIRQWFDEVTGEDICKRKRQGGASIPGRGAGNGFGHTNSNGLHLGHGGHESSIISD